MSFNTFREWLETDYVSPVTSRPLGHDAPSDYVSRLRLLSRLLDVDIQGARAETLEELATTFALHRAVAATQSPKAIIDMRVALRRYALYLRVQSGADAAATSDEARAEALARQLRNLGFDQTGARRHTFELRRGDLIVYVKRLSNTLPVVVAPEFEACFSALTGLDGITGSTPFAYYHNSQMPAFPKRLHGGRSSIHYGLAFDVGGPAALDRFVAALVERAFLAPAAEDRAEQNTETVRLQKARVGQGQFRADLFEVWGRCPLSGVSTPELLRASHIKPWRVSDRRERLDPNNGILLAVHFDCLFDNGFISFDEDGGLLISDRLSDAERAAFPMLDASRRILLTAGHLPYVAHHRTEVFLHGVQMAR